MKEEHRLNLDSASFFCITEHIEGTIKQTCNGNLRVNVSKSQMRCVTIRLTFAYNKSKNVIDFFLKCFQERRYYGKFFGNYFIVLKKCQKKKTRIFFCLVD